MARLTGIRHFFSEVSHTEEKEDASCLRRARKLEDGGEMLSREQSKIVPRLQDHCRGNFLQRHSKSTTPTGCPLLSLPPYHEIIGLLKLTEWEMKIIEDRAEAAKAA